MMRRTAFRLAFSLLFLIACQVSVAQGLLSDADREYYRNLLAERRTHYPRLDAAVFSVLASPTQSDASPTQSDEADALLFLLATTPVSDLVDHEASFLLANVRDALATRRRMSWGSRISDADFLHFVLPPRAGSEAVDSFRLRYSGELLRRVAGLTMREAVLEINHWCHERVTYAPSDARTRAPMATIRNAQGRCGEESVFATAALRAAGIPARQVYVPRWAHTDDNHAWVEAWVDGSWHFLGACEPDVDLDRAWFTEPARRAMLTAALVQGRYPHADEVLVTAPTHTRINTLPVYADTRLAAVRVQNGDGSPVTDARVDWGVYNYAEFFPVVSSRSDSGGVATLRTGRGDLLAWASHQGRHAFALYGRDRGDTLRLTLSSDVRDGGVVEIDIVPPPAVPLRQEEHPRAAETAARLRRGDSLRALYESSFPDSARVAAFATANGFPADSCWMLLRHARGNGTEILAFLAAARDIDRVPALAFLRTLAVKDLQDAPAAVLTAHYHGALAARPFSRPCDSLYMHFVCTPRIGREELRPWRATMREAVEGLRLPHDTHARISLARKISGWVRDSVRLDRAGNWGIVPQPVTATFALRSGDPYSRRLLLVAMLRSAGFPARLHPATGAAEFHAEGLWFNAGLEEADVRPTETSTLVLRPRAGQRIQSPVYARHFTLARFADGVYRTLDFEGDERFSSWPAGVSLQPGHYMLVTGNRLADGSVLAAMEFLTLRDGQTVEHVLRIRDDDAPPVPLGRIAASLLPEGSARAHVLLWIENGTEPVSHALRDIARERSSLAEHPVSFLLGGEGMNAGELRAIASEFLPESTLVAADGSMAERASALRDVLVETMQLPAGFTLPLVAVCDAQGNITFAARGYTIGVGSQILRILERMHVRD